MNILSTNASMEVLSAQICAQAIPCAAITQAMFGREGRLSSSSQPAMDLSFGKSFMFVGYRSEKEVDSQDFKNVVICNTQNPVGTSTKAAKYHTENEWSAVNRVGEHEVRLQ